jgi:hypothetical protein
MVLAWQRETDYTLKWNIPDPECLGLNPASNTYYHVTLSKFLKFSVPEYFSVKARVD